MEPNQKAEQDIGFIKELNLIYLILYLLFLLSLWLPYVRQPGSRISYSAIYFIFYPIFGLFLLGGILLFLLSIICVFSNQFRNAMILGGIGWGFLCPVFLVYFLVILRVQVPEGGLFIGFGSFIGLLIMLITIHKKRELLRPAEEKQKMIREKKRKEKKKKELGRVYLICTQCKASKIQYGFKKCPRCNADFSQYPPKTKKLKSPMGSVCCFCGFLIIMSVFFFGGLFPVIIAGVILLPVYCLISSSSSKFKYKLEGPSVPAQSIRQAEPLTSALSMQTRFCPECGSPMEGNQCKFCGKTLDSA